MYNMSYVRFENTSGALQECLDAMDEAITDGPNPEDFDSEEDYLEACQATGIERLGLSQREQTALRNMIGQMETFQILLDRAGIDPNQI